MSDFWNPEQEPPDDQPDHPSWQSPAAFDPHWGLWIRCGGIVVTAATRTNWLRYLEIKKTQQEREAWAAAKRATQPPRKRAAKKPAAPPAPAPQLFNDPTPPLRLL